MTSHEASSKRMICRIGKPIKVESTLWVTEAATKGSKIIFVDDTIGLHVGDDLVLSEQTLKLVSISKDSICVNNPISNPIPCGYLLIIDRDSWFIDCNPGKEVTGNYVPGDRHIRVPSDLLVMSAAIATIGNDKYFVSNIREGDSSLSLELKLVNTSLDWYSVDAEYPEGDQVVDTSWPVAPVLKPVKTSVSAHAEQANISSSLKGPGYIPSLSRLYLLPVWLPVTVGDSLKTVDGMVRVLGIDKTRIQRMQALTVNYYKGAET